jgi:hypothetical protein
MATKKMQLKSVDERLLHMQGGFLDSPEFMLSRDGSANRYGEPKNALKRTYGF